MNLDPGRELDALVAEKVMGISNSELKYHYGFSPYHYSTDITAAWLVVERLHELFPMNFFSINMLSKEYGGGFGVQLFGDCRVDEQSETAPHAICLAALRTMGIYE